MKLLILSLMLFMHSSVTQAETSEPADNIHSQKLAHCSSANLKAFLFFHVGQADFYADDCSIRLSPDVEKLLAFNYERDIPANAFTESSTNFLKKNLTSEEYQLWKNEIAAFNKGYQKTSKGDHYDIYYHPADGLKLYFNDKLVASNPDRQFASIYFSIWFGEKPFNHKLKRSLLANLSN